MSKVTKHTPGPWKHDNNTVYSLHLRNGKPSNRFYASIYVDFAYGVSAKEGEANARLMAAAPELLEALQMLLRSHRHLSFLDSKSMSDSPIEEHAQAAIDKALGNQ